MYTIGRFRLKAVQRTFRVHSIFPAFIRNEWQNGIESVTMGTILEGRGNNDSAA